MMQRFKSLLVSSLIILFFISSCGSPDSANEADFQQAVDAAVETTLTYVAAQALNADVPTETEPAPADTEIPPTETNFPPTETVSIDPTPEVIITHEMVPDAPTGRDAFVSDLSSYDNALEKSTLGDYYQLNRVERPFSAGEMDYFGDLDLVRVDMDAKSPWFYITFVLADDLRETGDLHYGIELDLDANGRGDYLIWAALPADTGWTVAGVQVLEDGDGDVGGIYPAFMNEPDPDLNGYETVIFDAGLGEDPDLAWVRRDPDYLNQIQIAFKEDIPGLLGFLWSAWADNGLMDPGMFEYNDQFTFEEAGSPTDEEIYYPLKEVAQVDSTCRSWYGFTPLGHEPGLCTGQGIGQPGDGDGDDQPGYGYCIEDPPQSGLCQNGLCLPTCPGGAAPCIICTFP